MVNRLLENVGWGQMLFAALSLAGTPGCYDLKPVDPGIEATPDGEGRVDLKQELGVQGQWFSYGDNADFPQSCTRIGLHPAEMCSAALYPKPIPPSWSFRPEDGWMCTAGSVGEAMPCAEDSLNCKKGDYDDANMWGAGIGLDFNLDPTDSKGKRNPLARGIWDAPGHHIVGVAFDLQLSDDGGLGGPHLRIDFPILLPEETLVEPGKVSFGLKSDDIPVAPPIGGMGARFPDYPIIPSEEHPDGSPYWGAPDVFGDGRTDVSPVRVGHNVIHFTDRIKAPESNYTFDPSRLLGIAFHVSSFRAAASDLESETGAHFSYGFCISNLTFLRE